MEDQEKMMLQFKNEKKLLIDQYETIKRALEEEIRNLHAKLEAQEQVLNEF